MTQFMEMIERLDQLNPGEAALLVKRIIDPNTVSDDTVDHYQIKAQEYAELQQRLITSAPGARDRFINLAAQGSADTTYSLLTIPLVDSIRQNKKPTICKQAVSGDQTEPWAVIDLVDDQNGLPTAKTKEQKTEALATGIRMKLINYTLSATKGADETVRQQGKREFFGLALKTVGLIPFDSHGEILELIHEGGKPQSNFNISTLPRIEL